MADVKEREERVLKFWEDRDIFRQSVRAREGATPFVFFEGPPTANANPAIHHFIGRVFKDLFGRYQTMRGRYVLRKGGWDTHGLPVELQVEKSLGFKSKKDIEAYGIAAFNKKCRESVWQFKEVWEQFTKRIGYWVDLDDPYITYENPYIESLWHIIGRIAKKDLLYRAHKVVPFCTRCGTPLSNHEVAQGYKTVTDTSVYVKFKVTGGKFKDAYILAWTTTPWTLPGNVALAVGKDIEYVLTDENLILAKERVGKIIDSPTIIQELKGSDLIGSTYEPLFKVKALTSPQSYQVYDADFVTTTDGTGVVHTAVMYGEDDYQLGTKLGLPKVHTVDEQGRFVGVSKGLDGKYVKDAETEEAILGALDKKLLRKEPYEHEYPFCWRCDTPLLYYAKDSWLIRTSAVNKELLANNAGVNWVPEHLRDGRFGQWLKEARDWTFSRERYWGTPLPVWLSDDGAQMLVVSSMEDLDTHRAKKANTYWMVRHGESDHNVAKRIDSGPNSSNLTPTGREQVEEAATLLAQKLNGKKPILFASPIARAQETAEIVARVLGVPVTTEERLVEIKLGPSLEGCHDSKYHEQYPTYHDKFTKRPPGGESANDLRARSWTLLRDLEQQYEGQDIVLVGHEYPIWMLTDAAQGWTMEQSVVEKEKRGEDFIGLAGIQEVRVRNLPRDEHGVVDLHRPYIDEIVLRHPESGVTLHRVPDVCDVWFDSGSMPYAQWHTPFEDGIFKSQFPADFITEGIDQTRGWFYTLMAVSTLLGEGAPYRNVVSYSHVLDEKGQKMSKSKGNVVKPEDVFDAVGVDAARWYFYTVNNPGDTKMFSMKDVRERLTGFIGTLDNCVKFYELYRSDDTTHPEPVEGLHLLDHWILSRLAGTADAVTKKMDAYDLTAAARAIEAFVVDDFSQWWLRRSRKRTEAIPLLRYVLREVALLSAPFVPFMAEDMWQKLKGAADAESVHLADWPGDAAQKINLPLEEQMKGLREAISAGLAIRKQENIKVRQPLASVVLTGTALPADLEALIKEELNVKSVGYGDAVSLDLHITPVLQGEGWAREVARTIQEMRKEAGLNVGDAVQISWWADDSAVADAIAQHLPHLVHQRDTKSLKLERTFDLAPGKSIWLGLNT